LQSGVFGGVIADLSRSAALLASILCIANRGPLTCASRTGHTILAFHPLCRRCAASSSRNAGILTPPLNNLDAANLRFALHRASVSNWSP
jgi:hypothetical protein